MNILHNIKQIFTHKQGDNMTFATPKPIDPKWQELNEAKHLFYTVADILKRGWTKDHIYILLGSPAKRINNPLNPTADIKLYSKEAVHSWEKNGVFRRLTKKLNDLNMLATTPTTAETAETTGNDNDPGF